MSDLVTVTYRPTEDEPYMNKNQQEYFRRKLADWRGEILRGSNETLRQLKEEDNRVADMSDWASFETERNFQLRRPRPRAQAARQDRRGDQAHRRRLLWLLRGNPGADRPAASRGAADRDLEHRGAGAARAPREGLSRRLTAGDCSLAQPGRAEAACLVERVEPASGRRSVRHCHGNCCCPRSCSAAARTITTGDIDVEASDHIRAQNEIAIFVLLRLRGGQVDVAGSLLSALGFS